jgi:hypothetical protein
MAGANIQSSFLEQVKKKLPAHVSLADELAEVLNVSRDSAYRRIRGETILSMDEVNTLSNKYHLSVDALFGHSEAFITFRHLIVNHTPQTFQHWLDTMHTNLGVMAAFSGNKQLSFTAKDIPIFHYFNYPRLCAFKMFFWMKSLLNYAEFQAIPFTLEAVPKKYLTLSKKIWEMYQTIPTVEIWADETANVTLKQLEFYKESGFFKTPQDIVDILEDYKNLIGDIRQQATSGQKHEGAAYTLYKNEILIADNTVLFDLDGQLTTFVSHNITELLMTTHEHFCKQTDVFITNLQNRSILISTTGERERNKFFNAINEKIEIAQRKVLAQPN